MAKTTEVEIEIEAEEPNEELEAEYIPKRVLRVAAGNGKIYNFDAEEMKIKSDDKHNNLVLERTIQVDDGNGGTVPTVVVEAGFAPPWSYRFLEM